MAAVLASTLAAVCLAMAAAASQASVLVPSLALPLVCLACLALVPGVLVLYLASRS